MDLTYLSFSFVYLIHLEYQKVAEVLEVCIVLYSHKSHFRPFILFAYLMTVLTAELMRIYPLLTIKKE